MTKIDLTDTTILLTGASSGIGKGLAQYLLKMGARVAVHYNSNKTAAKAIVADHPKTAKEFQADLSHEASIFKLFESVEGILKK